MFNVELGDKSISPIAVWRHCVTIVLYSDVWNVLFQIDIVVYDEYDRNSKLFISERLWHVIVEAVRFPSEFVRKWMWSVFTGIFSMSSDFVSLSSDFVSLSSDFVSISPMFRVLDLILSNLLVTYFCTELC